MQTSINRSKKAYSNWTSRQQDKEQKKGDILQAAAMDIYYDTAAVCTLWEMCKVIQDSRVISYFGSNFMWICGLETFTALTDTELLLL